MASSVEAASCLDSLEEDLGTKNLIQCNIVDFPYEPKLCISLAGLPTGLVGSSMLKIGHTYISVTMDMGSCSKEARYYIPILKQV